MKNLLIATAIVLVASIVALFIYWPRSIAADIHSDEQLAVDETARKYRIVIPHTLPQPAPIVFAFHGIGDSTESMASYSVLDRLASRNGFIVVYPAARKSMWTTMDADPNSLDANPDVRFFDQLIRHLSDRHDVDRDRVYVFGMSNGASFVQLLALARSNDIAAIVAHSGAKPRDLGSSANRIPIMLIVGADDPASTAMQSDAAQYRSDGHVVEYVSVPGLAHEWSTRHNTQMWEFVSQYSSERKP